MTILLSAALFGAVSIALLLTADHWLLSLLNGLDKILTRMGFGTWSAGALTAAERWLKNRKRER